MQETLSVRVVHQQASQADIQRQGAPSRYSDFKELRPFRQLRRSLSDPPKEVAVRRKLRFGNGKGGLLFSEFRRYQQSEQQQPEQGLGLGKFPFRFYQLYFVGSVVF